MSNDLEMSRNTARTSKQSVLSKAWWISSARYNSWFVVESPGRKIICFNKPFGNKISVKMIANNFFKNLSTQQREEILAYI